MITRATGDRNSWKSRAGGLSSDHIPDLMRGVPAPLILVGRDERIIDLNDHAEALFGANMVGRHFLTMLRQPDVIDAISAAFRSGSEQETRYTRKELSTETVYRVLCAPVGAEPVVAVLASFEDVTSIETASQMRRDFVANVSHELRTPLTALVGFIETLRGPARNDSDARERFLEIMEREAVRMNRLVDDLLSLSRVETEERVRPTELQRLPDLVDSVCLNLKPLAEGAQVEFNVQGQGDLPLVRGDADQLMQVFTNLIENAIKYGRGSKEIRIRYNTVTRDPNLGTQAVVVAIEDDGPGIDTIHLHRLTERFYRVDDHRAKALGGTGLGLAIVKHIMNRHRGRLKIESTPGEGSIFSVILPAQRK